jgi:putative spermidine/putrescine transport system ATP-binding protein
MAALSIDSVSKAYGPALAVDAVSLEVGDSEFVALLGPSGCGKTSLLRIVAGFLAASSGRVRIGGKDVTDTPPHKRNTGMVFQSYALFPHMTVAENIAFGLRMRAAKDTEIGAKVAEALQLVRLGGMDARYPRELSGGQQQRVAIARALIIRPDVFLLDEPLSNLDAKLRQSVGLEIRALQQSLGLTTVFVTHDQNEALALADRLILMNQGRVVQSGTAAELYANPANTFVANFLGRANLLPGRVESGTQFLTDSGLAVACDTGPFATGARAILCLRPENIDIGAGAEGRANRFPARIESATFLGSTTQYALRVGSSDQALLVDRANREGSTAPSRGEECTVGWRVSGALLLPQS